MLKFKKRPNPVGGPTGNSNFYAAVDSNTQKFGNFKRAAAREGDKIQSLSAQEQKNIAQCIAQSEDEKDYGIFAKHMTSNSHVFAGNGGSAIIFNDADGNGKLDVGEEITVVLKDGTSKTVKYDGSKGNISVGINNDKLTGSDKEKADYKANNDSFADNLQQYLMEQFSKYE